MGFYVDDHRLQEIRHNIGYMQRDPKRLVKPMLKDRRYYDWACSNLDHLTWVIDALNTKRWPTTIAPAFEWGDHSLIERELFASHVEFVDPSPYTPPHAIVPASERSRVWISASLPDRKAAKWLNRQNLTWPVESFGARGNRVTESEVVRRYAQSRGVIAIPHQHAGSGWWRVRFVHAAATGALMRASGSEIRGIGGSYFLPDEAESMTDSMLSDLAVAQAAELRSRAWTTTRFRDEMHRIVTELHRAQVQA